MSQQEILKFLKGKDWTTTSEITKKTGITRETANENLRRMYKYGEVLRRTEFLKRGGRRYLWKLR